MRWDETDVTISSNAPTSQYGTLGSTVIGGVNINGALSGTVNIDGNTGTTGAEVQNTAVGVYVNGDATASNHGLLDATSLLIGPNNTFTAGSYATWLNGGEIVFADVSSENIAALTVAYDGVSDTSGSTFGGNIAYVNGTAVIPYGYVGANDTQGLYEARSTTATSALPDATLTATVSDITVNEIDGSAALRVNLNKSYTEDVTIMFELENNSDISLLSSANTFTKSDGTSVEISYGVLIPAGATYADVNLSITQDSVSEANETVEFTLLSTSHGIITDKSASITIVDSERTISSTGEMTSLSVSTMDKAVKQITDELTTSYNALAANSGATWRIDEAAMQSAVESIMPGVRTIVGLLYNEVETQIAAAASQSDVETFAQSAMVANVATKSFAPLSYIGVEINGDGTYPAGKSLSTLQSAVSSDYQSLVALSSEAIGDVFGTDTATNFPNATVSILTDGNDTTTLTSGSEIVATLDGTDNVYAGDGNDKLIGGADVDKLYGQGGADHLYGFKGNDILDGGDGNDRIVGGLGDDQIDGGAGDDYILAQTGNDIVVTGTGTDEVQAGLGDDSITVDGVGDKTIDGGTGTNTLAINYAGLSGLSDFQIGSVSREADASWTLTASNSDVITFKNIIDYTYTSGAAGYWDGSITVAAKAYRFVSDMRSDTSPFSGAYGSVQAFVHQDGTAVEVVLSEGGKWLPQYRMSSYKDFSFNGTETYSIHGSAGSEVIFGGYQADTITAGDGNDFIFGGDGADNINAGAGDDVIYTSLAGLTEDTAVSGGSGSNTLAFNKPGEAGGWDNESYNSVSFNLSTDLGNANNFQNIVGSNYDDNLTGDNSTNVIIGGSGSDILTGSGGNDELYGDYHTSDTSGTKYGYRQYGVSEGNDQLFGGDGNDILVGNNGDDQLDGGTGADTITTGTGTDTIVLRAGDGGSDEASADTITDFTDGTDVLGLADGLQFSQLTIAQGSGDYVNDTLVSVTSTSEYLAVLRGISASQITEADFQPLLIA